MVAAGAVAVEDLHAGPIDEAALFHLLNLAGERGAPVLLTSRRVAGGAAAERSPTSPRACAPLGRWNWASRTTSCSAASSSSCSPTASSPSTGAVVDYIVVRMERSLEAANLIVAELDREALAESRAITRPLAAAALARLFGGEED